MRASVDAGAPKFPLPRKYRVALVAGCAVRDVQVAPNRFGRAADVDDHNRIAIAVDLWGSRRNALRGVCERAVFLHALLVP